MQERTRELNDVDSTFDTELSLLPSQLNREQRRACGIRTTKQKLIEAESLTDPTP